MKSIVCTCGKNFGSEPAMLQHRRDSLMYAASINYVQLAEQDRDVVIPKEREGSVRTDSGFSYGLIFISNLMVGYQD